jgi:hypothetical protein
VNEAHHCQGSAEMRKMTAMVHVEFELKEGQTENAANAALLGGIGALKLAIEHGVTGTGQTAAKQGSVQANIADKRHFLLSLPQNQQTVNSEQVRPSKDIMPNIVEGFLCAVSHRMSDQRCNSSWAVWPFMPHPILPVGPDPN